MDDALTAEERADVARHLDQCAHCRGVVRDLERLRSAARQLGPVRPPDHIWLEIAGQVHAVAGSPAPPASASPRRPVVWQWMGLAAMLVLVTMAVYFVMRAPRVAPASNAGRDQAVQAVADELQLAMQHLENGIAQLEALTKNSDGTMIRRSRRCCKRTCRSLMWHCGEPHGAREQPGERAGARESVRSAAAQGRRAAGDGLADEPDPPGQSRRRGRAPRRAWNGSRHRNLRASGAPRRSGAGRWGPRERRREGVRRDEVP